MLVAAGRHSLDQVESTLTTSGTERRIDPGDLLEQLLPGRFSLAERGFRNRPVLQELSAKGEVLLPASVGQKAVVADAHESMREDVEKKTTDEFPGGKAHLPLHAAMGVILPGEGHVIAFQAHKALVGDGDAMRVAGEVSENLLRSTKGRLAVDHPRLGVERRQESGEGARILIGGKRALEIELTCLVGLFQRGENLATEQARQHAHREEESLSAPHPPTIYR